MPRESEPSNDESLFETIWNDYQAIVHAIDTFCSDLSSAESFEAFVRQRDQALRILEGTYRQALEDALETCTEDILMHMRVFALYHDQHHQLIKGLRMHATMAGEEEQWRQERCTAPVMPEVSRTDLKQCFGESGRTFQAEREVRWLMMDTERALLERLGIDWKTQETVRVPFIKKEFLLRDVRLRTQYPESLGSVRVPCEELVAQMVAGIAHNAWAALKQSLTKTVDITITPTEKEHERGDTGNGITITIEDSGPGFPDEMLQRFNPETESIESTTGGSGMWLTMCARIIREHLHGTLVIANRHGGGGRVRMNIPLPEEQSVNVSYGFAFKLL